MSALAELCNINNWYSVGTGDDEAARAVFSWGDIEDATAELDALRERVKRLRGLVEEASTMRKYLTKPHEWDDFFERVAAALEQP